MNATLNNAARTTKNNFSMTRFQDNLIAKLECIDANGVGDHKLRSAARARRNAIRSLVGLGYSDEAARDAVTEAWDVYQLQKNAD